jgi:threonine dehydrogenase-like Zn-dependent dehydrogenase
MVQQFGFKTIRAGEMDVLQEVKEWTHGYGADVTFDAAGVPQTASQVIPITGTKGRIIMVAIHKKPAEVAFRDLAYKELSIQGTRIYAKGSFEQAIDLVSKGRVNVKSLITDVFPMRDALNGFEVAQNDRAACKVLIEQEPGQQKAKKT